MEISILLSYYKRLLLRNPKLYGYFIITIIVYFIAVGLFVFLQSIEASPFNLHRMLIFSYLFQFFYNHSYYGLGWESSFKHFVIFHMKIKNIIFMYIFLNFLYFIFSFIFLKILAIASWLLIKHSIINIIIVYLIIPNLLFVFVFPFLTISINLFDSKKGLVIHKFYGFPLLIFAIALPAILQYVWSNFPYGPELVCAVTAFLMLFVIIRFHWVVKFWETRLLKIQLE